MGNVEFREYGQNPRHKPPTPSLVTILCVQVEHWLFIPKQTPKRTKIEVALKYAKTYAKKQDRPIFEILAASLRIDSALRVEALKGAHFNKITSILFNTVGFWSSGDRISKMGETFPYFLPLPVGIPHFLLLTLVIDKMSSEMLSWTLKPKMWLIPGSALYLTKPWTSLKFEECFWFIMWSNYKKKKQLKQLFRNNLLELIIFFFVGTECVVHCWRGIWSVYLWGEGKQREDKEPDEVSRSCVKNPAANVIAGLFLGFLENAGDSSANQSFTSKFIDSGFSYILLCLFRHHRKHESPRFSSQ